jgi:hypothetical protein
MYPLTTTIKTERGRQREIGIGEGENRLELWWGGKESVGIIWCSITLNELKLSASWPLDGCVALLTGVGSSPSRHSTRRLPVLLTALHTDGFTMCESNEWEEAIIDNSEGTLLGFALREWEEILRKWAKVAHVSAAIPRDRASVV